MDPGSAPQGRSPPRSPTAGRLRIVPATRKARQPAAATGAGGHHNGDSSGSSDDDVGNADDAKAGKGAKMGDNSFAAFVSATSPTGADTHSHGHGSGGNGGHSPSSAGGKQFNVRLWPSRPTASATADSALGGDEASSTVSGTSSASGTSASSARGKRALSHLDAVCRVQSLVRGKLARLAAQKQRLLVAWHELDRKEEAELQVRPRILNFDIHFVSNEQQEPPSHNYIFTTSIIFKLDVYRYE